MKRSVGKVNANDDDLESVEVVVANHGESRGTSSESRELQNMEIVVTARRDVREESRRPDQGESSGSSTDSDIGDVLNCLRSPHEILLKCRTTCPKTKKDEDTHYKEAGEYLFDRYFEDGDIGSNSSDYFMAPAKPVRIPIVHVKDCLHEDDLRIVSSQDPANIKWCYCEDEGTSEEDDDSEKPNILRQFEEESGVSIIKYSPPRQIDNFEEKEAISWDKIPVDSNLQDILNSMFPPVMYRIDGHIWIKEVSPEPARRSEVAKLVETIQIKMKDEQGKNFGVDPVRRNIYDQLFDELIRQETITCAETGLLLLRLRDEMSMSIAAWESLLDHANNFAMKHIHSTGKLLSPLQEQIDVLVRTMEGVEQKRLDFWAEQYLNKSEDKKKTEHMNSNRKMEIAPLQARYKILKEQIRMLENLTRDDEI